MYLIANCTILALTYYNHANNYLEPHDYANIYPSLAKDMHCKTSRGKVDDRAHQI